MNIEEENNTPSPENDPLLHPREAAKELKSAYGTLAIWRHQNRGPNYVKIGGRVYYRRSAIEEYLDARTVKVGA